MSDDGVEAAAGLFPVTVGERLRAARVGAGLDVGDVATRTRVPMRHLEAIERGNYATLPSPTYAVGFARSYARAVGIDEAEVARDLRSELGRTPVVASPEVAAYQPADPSRVPSRLLAFTALGILVLLAGAYALWRSAWWSAQTSAIVSAPVDPAVAPPPPTTPTAASGAGQVVLTATAPVWLRIYEKAGTRLFEKEMTAGESYTLPANAVEPLLLTGRPQAVQVTIDGTVQPPLGPPDRSISDVGISSAAFAARAAGTVGQPTQPISALPRQIVRDRSRPGAMPVAANALTGPTVATDPEGSAPAPVASPPPPGNSGG